MGYIGIQICDFCGRRSEDLVSRLTLHHRSNTRAGIGTTIRTWMLCQYCFKKLSGMKAQGDNIKEEIEIQLDKIRGDNSNIKILEHINKEGR
jgi:L-lysine 2,3-aminomutase